MTKPEDLARETIDQLLASAGWHVCDTGKANLSAYRGVAIREFSLEQGHGIADYLLYVDGVAAGVIEAKKAGSTLSGVGIQAAKYTKGLPRYGNPLPLRLPVHRRGNPFHQRAGNGAAILVDYVEIPFIFPPTWCKVVHWRDWEWRRIRDAAPRSPRLFGHLFLFQANSMKTWNASRRSERSRSPG